MAYKSGRYLSPRIEFAEAVGVLRLPNVGEIGHEGLGAGT